MGRASYHESVPDPYREPMPVPPPPRDDMRIVLFVTGGIAVTIAAIAIVVGVMDARSSVAEAPRTKSQPQPEPVGQTISEPAPPPKRQDFPLVADDSETPADFDVTYTSPDSMIPSYTVTVDAHGKATMTYIADEGVIATLAPNVVRDLWHLVSRHQFFKWRDDLTDDHPGMTDHFPMGLAASANGQHNAIRCLDRCPAGTGEIVELIERETKPQDWFFGKKKLPSKRKYRGNDVNSLLDTR